jgi:hypothetical protein
MFSPIKIVSTELPSLQLSIGSVECRGGQAARVLSLTDYVIVNGQLEYDLRTSRISAALPFRGTRQRSSGEKIRVHSPNDRLAIERASHL